MNAVESRPEISRAQPALRVVPRQHPPDEDAPPFFAQFSRDGRTLVLLTPATRETYLAQPRPNN